MKTPAWTDDDEKAMQTYAALSDADFTEDRFGYAGRVAAACAREVLRLRDAKTSVTPTTVGEEPKRTLSDAAAMLLHIDGYANCFDPSQGFSQDEFRDEFEGALTLAEELQALASSSVSSGSPIQDEQDAKRYRAIRDTLAPNDGRLDLSCVPGTIFTPHRLDNVADGLIARDEPSEHTCLCGHENAEHTHTGWCKAVYCDCKGWGANLPRDHRPASRSSHSGSDDPTLSDVIAWLRGRPGTSWVATIQDIAAAVLALRSPTPSPGHESNRVDVGWKRLAMQALRYLTSSQIAEAAAIAGAEVVVCTTPEEINRAIAVGTPVGVRDVEPLTRYGIDCPVGKVQVEFVSTGAERSSRYGWLPAMDALLEIYVDGKRFSIKVGDFHDGRARRRGLHIIGPIDMGVEHTSMNAASLFLKSSSTPEAKT